MSARTDVLAEWLVACSITPTRKPSLKLTYSVLDIFGANKEMSLKYRLVISVSIINSKKIAAIGLTRTAASPALNKSLQ